MLKIGWPIHGALDMRHALPLFLNLECFFSPLSIQILPIPQEPLPSPPLLEILLEFPDPQ